MNLPEIFADKLSNLGFGYPCWKAGDVRVGEVGTVKDGKFDVSFNAMEPAHDIDHTQELPIDHTPYTSPFPPVSHELHLSPILSSEGLSYYLSSNHTAGISAFWTGQKLR